MNTNDPALEDANVIIVIMITTSTMGNKIGAEKQSFVQGVDVVEVVSLKIKPDPTEMSPCKDGKRKSTCS